MAQGVRAMNPEQVRIVDPVQTIAARGYRHPTHVRRVLFPTVPTSIRGGRRIEFDRRDFRKVNLRRARGADRKRVQFGYEGKPFSLVEDALDGKLPVEDLADARVHPGIDLGMTTVTSALALISLQREIAAAETATTAANYAAGHTMALAAAARWSVETVHPSAAIRVAVSAIREATGMRPNVAVIGGKVFDYLQYHPLILDRVHGDSASQTPAMAEDIARLWKLDMVAVGDAIYTDEDDDTHDVWGSNVVLAYARVGTPMMREPTFGLGYTLTGGPWVEQAWFDRGCSSWLYPVTEEYADLIVGQDAGYLISSVI